MHCSIDCTKLFGSIILIEPATTRQCLKSWYQSNVMVGLESNENDATAYFQIGIQDS